MSGKMCFADKTYENIRKVITKMKLQLEYLFNKQRLLQGDKND